MELKCGFVEFYDKEDKVIANFFKDAYNKDILGLRKMNVRMSNVLFPFGNTLMPNLVYMYYLNAIYHVLKEKNDLSTENIDFWETKISQWIVNFKESEKKGFMNTAQIRAYSRYRNNMKRMEFFDDKWCAYEGMESQLEKLKKTERYKFVNDVVNDGIEGKLSKYPYKDWVDKLEDVERLDFIRRVVRPYKDEHPNFSLFTHIVMNYCGLQRIPRKNETILNDDFFDEKYEDKGIKLKTFEEIELGNVNGEGVNRKKDYDIALIYSKLQQIAKYAYNLCLFDSNESKKEDYNKKLIDEVNKFKKKWIDKEVKFDHYFLGKQRNKEYKIFVGKTPGDDNIDPDLKCAFDFVYELAKCIKDNKENIECKNFVPLASELMEKVKEREETIMGDESILGSGIQADRAMPENADTFRWQYRPEYYVEDSESQGIDATEEGQAKDIKVKGEFQPMSASYYIYELFYEGREKNG